jgi:hypothetical protein
MVEMLRASFSVARSRETRVPGKAEEVKVFLRLEPKSSLKAPPKLRLLSFHETLFAFLLPSVYFSCFSWGQVAANISAIHLTARQQINYGTFGLVKPSKRREGGRSWIGFCFPSFIVFRAIKQRTKFVPSRPAFAFSLHLKAEKQLKRASGLPRMLDFYPRSGAKAIKRRKLYCCSAIMKMLEYLK